MNLLVGDCVEEPPVCTYFVKLWLSENDYRATIQEETVSGKKLPPHLAGETLLNAADALRKAAEKHYPEVVSEWTEGR